MPEKPDKILRTKSFYFGILPIKFSKWKFFRNFIFLQRPSISRYIFYKEIIINFVSYNFGKRNWSTLKLASEDFVEMVTPFSTQKASCLYYKLVS